MRPHSTFVAALLGKPRLNEAEADFVAKWQQLTPAVMAKGVEDTTFYCFDRLVSGNEVGSQASLVGISADKFHEFCHYLSDRWPNNLLATSTHDNKRSEDVRARISILSEIPERWSEALHEWSQMNAPAWKNRVPDRHAEYLLYQTLIGAWPIDRERCWQYMQKACREAKISTSWHEPNGGYEDKIRGFIDGIFETPEFIHSLERFVDPLILPGRINSLAQTLIKMVAPGVPDFYQGTELWDLSLVDPDNRRPVDYALRSRLMRRARVLSAAEALAEWDSGLPKLWMTARILSVRRERAEDFSDQSKYQPLVAQGTHLGRLLAFRRGENLIAVVPRFTRILGGEWGDTRLAAAGRRMAQLSYGGDRAAGSRARRTVQVVSGGIVDSRRRLNLFVWAPSAKSVELVTPEHRVALRPGADGAWQAEVDFSVLERGYRYSIDGGDPMPDPRSRWQPDGVHGASYPVSSLRPRAAPSDANGGDGEANATGMSSRSGNRRCEVPSFTNCTSVHSRPKGPTRQRRRSCRTWFDWASHISS